MTFRHWLIHHTAAAAASSSQLREGESRSRLEQGARPSPAHRLQRSSLGPRGPAVLVCTVARRQPGRQAGRRAGRQASKQRTLVVLALAVLAILAVLSAGATIAAAPCGVCRAERDSWEWTHWSVANHGRMGAPPQLLTLMWPRQSPPGAHRSCHSWSSARTVLRNRFRLQQRQVHVGQGVLRGRR